MSLEFRPKEKNWNPLLSADTPNKVIVEIRALQGKESGDSVLPKGDLAERSWKAGATFFCTTPGG